MSHDLLVQMAYSLGKMETSQVNLYSHVCGY